MKVVIRVKVVATSIPIRGFPAAVVGVVPHVPAIGLPVVGVPHVPAMVYPRLGVVAVVGNIPVIFPRVPVVPVVPVVAVLIKDCLRSAVMVVKTLASFQYGRLIQSILSLLRSPVSQTRQSIRLPVRYGPRYLKGFQRVRQSP
jgi:hypothetical protein